MKQDLSTAHSRRLSAAGWQFELGDGEVDPDIRRLERIPSLRDPKWRRVFGYIRPRLGKLIGIGALALTHGGLTATTLVAVVTFIHLAIEGSYGADGSVGVMGIRLPVDVEALLPEGRAGLSALFVAMVLLLVGLSAMRFAQQHLALKLQKEFLGDLRRDLFDRLLALDITFFTDTRLGEVAHRQTFVVNRLAMLIPMLQEALLAAFNIAMILVVLFLMSWPISLVMLACSFALVFAIRRMRRRGAVLSRQAMERTKTASAVLLDAVYGMRLIRQGGQEERARRTYLKAAFSADSFTLGHQNYGNLVRAVSEVASALIVLTITALASWLMGFDLLGNIGLTAGFFIVAWGAAPHLARVIDLLTRLARLWPYVHAVAEFLEDAETPKPRLGVTRAAPAPLKHGLAVEGVSFAYGDGPRVLRDVKLAFKKGTRTALVGLSGSGKSTLLELLSGFQRPTTGTILIDGHSLDEIDLTGYRRSVGYVSQETILFNDTILENIRFFRPEATVAEVKRAAHMAEATQFIAEAAAGYETVLGERGLKVSGGQRQRITLARVFLQDPEILLLDEATSALDLQTERAIFERLTRIGEDKVVIVAAHRLSAIQDFDSIVVLSEGRVIEQGDHKSLMAQGGLYAHLYGLQQYERDGGYTSDDKHTRAAIVPARVRTAP